MFPVPVLAPAPDLAHVNLLHLLFPSGGWGRRGGVCDNLRHQGETAAVCGATTQVAKTHVKGFRLDVWSCRGI